MTNFGGPQLGVPGEEGELSSISLLVAALGKEAAPGQKVVTDIAIDSGSHRREG